jgi:hypothetical protein
MGKYFCNHCKQYWIYSNYEGGYDASCPDCSIGNSVCRPFEYEDPLYDLVYKTRKEAQDGDSTGSRADIKQG